MKLLQNILFIFHCFATGLHPCFVVFDVLLVNGKSIASLPLEERVENLKKYDTKFAPQLKHENDVQLARERCLVNNVNIMYF